MTITLQKISKWNSFFTGHLLAVASNDATIKMIEIGTSDVTMLAGHDDAVQAVDFDKGGQFLISGGSDGTLRMWS